MKIKKISWLFILCALVLAGCAPKPGATSSGPTVLTDGLGRQVSFDVPAQKIVSIAPSNTEILFALGAASQVVGRDEFSDFPEQAKALPSIGGGYGALDMEKMVALQPDLVLASQLTPAEQVAAIEKLGLKTYLLPNPKDIEGMFDNLQAVGKITGREKEAQNLIVQLRKRVAAVDARLAKIDQKPTVFYELDNTDPNAPWTAGQGSFIDTLIKRAGGVNIGAQLSDAYAQISVEKLLEDNPQIIILGDYTYGGVKPEDVLARQAWAGMDAIKQKKVYTFDDNLVSRPGPRLVDGLEALAALLHPVQ
jgi:iron complex transport system substrate-binding protein